MSAETIEPAAADAVAALLDLLLTDGALGVLNRANPGGSGLQLAAHRRRHGGAGQSAEPSRIGWIELSQSNLE
jgi:hypothetical protein